MSVRLEVVPRIFEECHNTTQTDYNYTGFWLEMRVYAIWDNRERYTSGNKYVYMFMNNQKISTTECWFNYANEKSGRELIGYTNKLFKSSNDLKYYYSSNITCSASCDVISDDTTSVTFPARNLYSGFIANEVSYSYLNGKEAFDEQNAGVYITLQDEIGLSNRKWRITDSYGKVIIQGDYEGTDTEYKKYWIPTESELDLIYASSYYDTGHNAGLQKGKNLIFRGNLDFTGTYNGKNYISTAPVTLDTLGKHPTAVITIKDTDTTTKALTGDESKFIRYFSDMNINVAWTTYGSEISSYSTKCNINYVFKDKSTISVKNIIDTKCTFTCSDTKGLTTTITKTPVLIPYTKLTCVFQPTMSLEGDISFTTSGNYFNSNFGVQNNSLTLQYRYKLKDGSYGNWIAITPTIEGNSYSGNVAFKIPDFQYQNVYVFQVKATDKLMEILTPEYTVNSTPVFDWSKNDFNFNVPVTIKGVPVYVEEVLYNSTSTSDRDSTLISGKFSDYDYIEILYCDNNSRGWGSTKIYKPENDMLIDLSLTESANNSGNFYFRHSRFKIQNDNEIVKTLSSYNFYSATNNAFTNSTGNMIKIRRILGYRGITQ